MRKSRRDLISVVGGTIVAGLAGCVEKESKNGSNGTIDAKDGSNSDSGSELSNVESKVISFVNEFKCSSSQESFKNIQSADQDSEIYEFSGIEKIEGDCYSAIANSRIKDRKLLVNINITDSDSNCNQCSQTDLSYSGTVKVTNPDLIDQTEININKLV